MNSLEEVVVPVAEVKVKKVRKSKKVAEPVFLPVLEELVAEPVVEEPVVQEPLSPVQEEEHTQCAVCGEDLVSPFTDAEMDIYRRINAYKRKLLRLKKVACVSAEV
jgi:hypothetical protein